MMWQCKKCDSKFAGKAYSVERVFTSKDSDKIVKDIEIYAKREEGDQDAEAAEEQPVEAQEEAR